jgi:hypothetical protein
LNLAKTTLEPAQTGVRISASSPDVLKAIYAAQALVSSGPQAEVETTHVLHAGMYARTVRVPAGVRAVGTLIKIPTLLIVQGDMDMWSGEDWLEIRGYGVLPGEAGRKALFVTRSDVWMTMLFATQAQTVDEAERECTDEYEDLITRRKETGYDMYSDGRNDCGH